VEDHHGVPLPRFAGALVANASPEIDDLLAAVIDAAGAAQLAASREVLDERLVDPLEAPADLALDFR
jgi:hypothetical protein